MTNEEFTALPAAIAEIERLRAVNEQAVAGRADFREAYRGQLVINSSKLSGDEMLDRMLAISADRDALATEATRLRALVVEACQAADDLNGDNGDNEELTRRRDEIADIRRRAEAGGKP